MKNCINNSFKPPNLPTKRQQKRHGKYAIIN
jgi:hypothetical protein